MRNLLNIFFLTKSLDHLSMVAGACANLQICATKYVIRKCKWFFVDFSFSFFFFSFLYWMRFTFAGLHLSSCPTELFTALKLQNPSIDVPLLRQISLILRLQNCERVGRVVESSSFLFDMTPPSLLSFLSATARLILLSYDLIESCHFKKIILLTINLDDDFRSAKKGKTRGEQIDSDRRPGKRRNNKHASLLCFSESLLPFLFWSGLYMKAGNRLIPKNVGTSFF